MRQGRRPVRAVEGGLLPPVAFGDSPRGYLWKDEEGGVEGRYPSVTQAAMVVARSRRSVA